MEVTPRLNLKVAIWQTYGTQKAFAAIVGDDEPTVSKVVQGRLNLSAAHAARYARALGKRVEELFPAETEGCR